MYEMTFKAVPISETNLNLAVNVGSNQSNFFWAAGRNGCEQWDLLTVRFKANSTNTTLRITGALKGDIAIDNIDIKGNQFYFDVLKNQRCPIAFLMLSAMDMENAPMLNRTRPTLCTASVIQSMKENSATHMLLFLMSVFFLQLIQRG